jgi:pimeloyl-ACP methyl ester carboxylesterase
MLESELTVGELPATLSLPEGPARAGVVPLHPAADGSRRQFLFEHLVDTLVPREIAVLRFDRRPPRGDEDIPFSVQAADALVVLLAACGVSPAEQMRYGTAEQLRRNGYGADAVSELGELRDAFETALREPGRLAASQAVIDRYAERPWFPLSYVARTLELSDEWPDIDFDPAPILAEVQCPVLLFYGEEDEWTPIEPSIDTWQRAATAAGNHDLTVVQLPDTDHAPTLGGVHEQSAISPAYTEALTEWLDRRLGHR